jgi:hypothetical protein
LNGHGTFTASLILDYAPDAELYIIKIADENATPSAETVAKVCSHASNAFTIERKKAQSETDYYRRSITQLTTGM